MGVVIVSPRMGLCQENWPLSYVSLFRATYCTIGSGQYTLLSGFSVQTEQVLFKFKFTTRTEWINNRLSINLKIHNTRVPISLSWKLLDILNPVLLNWIFTVLLIWIFTVLLIWIFTVDKYDFLHIPRFSIFLIIFSTILHSQFNFHTLSATKL